MAAPPRSEFFLEARAAVGASRRRPRLPSGSPDLAFGTRQLAAEDILASFLADSGIGTSCEVVCAVAEGEDDGEADDPHDWVCSGVASPSLNHCLFSEAVREAVGVRASTGE